MQHFTTLILYALALLGIMQAVDHTVRLQTATDLASAGAFRAGRALVSRLDADGRLTSGALDAAREQAALALLPVTPDHATTAPAAPDTAQAATRLASELGLRFAGSLPQAVGRTTVSAWRNGAPLREGDRVAANDLLTVLVTFQAPVRPDPLSGLFADGQTAGRPSRAVSGGARLVVGGAP